MKAQTFITSAILGLAIATPLANAAVIIQLNNFESNITPWTATGTSTGQYIATTTLQPAGAPTTNFAPNGSGAVRLGQSGGTITSGTLALAGGGTSESITISFGLLFYNGSTTRRGNVEFSNDNGSTWFRLATLQTGGATSNLTAYSGSVTINEGSTTVSRSGNILSNNGGTAYNGSAFSNTSMIRINNLGSAGGDGFNIFIDDLQVTTTAPVPEPSAALLGAIGSLLLIRRRRA